MSYASWSRQHFVRPPFFATIWRDVCHASLRLYKEWMAWFDITV